MTKTFNLATCSLIFALAAPWGAEAKPKIHFTSHERSACRSESIRYCTHTYPNKRDLVGCLQSHSSSLGNACRKALYHGVSRRPSLSH